MVTQNTRQRNNQESLLDLILCNDESLISEINYYPPIGKSDHVVLVAEIQLVGQVTNESTSKRRAFNYGDYDLINNYLLTFDIPETDSIDNMWTVFKENIHRAIDNFIPKIKCHKRYKSKPWITKEICQLTDKKKKLWNIYLLDKNNNQSYKNYRSINNKIVKLARQNRIDFESNVANSGEKAFYAYVRKQISTRVNVPPALINQQTNEIITKSVEVAEIFADQFENAYVCEPPGLLPEVSIQRVQASLENIEFTREKVLKSIKNFDESTATGPDSIPAIMLQKCSAIIDQATSLMNLSFTTGKLPTDWKNAVVTPIFKKGNKLNAENYRPISLTCILCKTMEKIIADRLRDFTTKENIIIPEQHGFTPRRSTTTNLLSCLREWIISWDNHQATDIIYLDYEKAFDRVPIRRLLHKLEHLGIRGKLLVWISNFLNERKFCVRVGDELSSVRPVRSGVPQGSVLGPILFTLFLTDLQNVISLPFSLFADDTKFFGNPIHQQNCIQQNLNAIEHWTKEWLLSLNINKCTVLHIGKNNPKVSYFLDNNKLKAVDTQKDLGVIISSDLKWEAHIVAIVNKANSILYLIRKAFFNITKKTFLKIYKTYVRPLLEYTFLVWNPYFSKDIELLERVQRRATKLPRELKTLTYEQRLLKLGLSTLKCRRDRGDLIETYKILNNYYNVPNFEKLLLKKSNSGPRGHNFKLQHKLASSNPLKHFLTNRVVHIWNKLPKEVVTSSSINQFKNRLDKYIKNSKHE